MESSRQPVEGPGPREYHSKESKCCTKLIDWWCLNEGV